MPRVDKALDRMRANPRNWRIGRLERVAVPHGVNVRKRRRSHVVFEHPAVAGSGVGAGPTADQAGLCPQLYCILRRRARKP